MKLAKWLQSEKQEFVFSRQLLWSETSVGTNVEEAIGGQSERDFLSKMSIAYKDARESHYWLRLLHDSGELPDTQFNSIIQDCDELLKLTGSICKTLRMKNS